MSFAPLYKFGKEVLDLAKQIPEIDLILKDLKSRKVPIHLLDREGGGLYCDYLNKRVAMTLGSSPNPLDTLGFLVHEYYHLKSANRLVREILVNRDYFIEYKIQEEIFCYTKQAEFLTNNIHLGSTDQVRLMIEYKKNRMDSFIRSFRFGDGFMYYEFYAKQYDDYRDILLSCEDWIPNEIRIQSC